MCNTPKTPYVDYTCNTCKRPHPLHSKTEATYCRIILVDDDVVESSNSVPNRRTSSWLSSLTMKTLWSCWGELTLWIASTKSGRDHCEYSHLRELSTIIGWGVEIFHVDSYKSGRDHRVFTSRRVVNNYWLGGGDWNVLWWKKKFMTPRMC